MKFARTGLALVSIIIASTALPAHAVEQLLGRTPSSETPSSGGHDVRGTAMHPLVIRKGPGKSFTRLGEFPKGSSLVFLSPPGCIDGYCFVQGPRGVRGWVLAEAVARTPESRAGKGTRSDIVGYAVSRNPLNLRSGPSEYDNKLGIVPRGETIHLLRSPPCRNGYCYVETQNRKRGWVLRSAISLHGY
jgi:uncharacterized protein YraI